MEEKQFNPIEYFKELASSNRLAHENNFVTTLCSGPDNLEGIMKEYRKAENFIIIDDTTDNNVHGNRPGWFTKSVYTVWILAGTEYNDPVKTKQQMELCRLIFKQFLSRMIRDRDTYAYDDALRYLGLDKIYYKELGRYSFNGCTGLYFMVENDVATDLTYKEDDWEE